MVPKTLRAFLFLMALITAACGGIVPQDFDKGASPPSKIPADPETAASALAIMSTRTVEQSNSPSKASEISGKSPPASHLTPAPLTTKAMDSCPMSMPNLDTSPDEYYISTELGYGNPEGTLFIGLWPGSKVLFFPDGPGQISSTGLRMKFWFYRTVPGEITFSGERLDATAQPLPEITLPGVDDGYDESGFHPAELVFPSEGCWQVTASVADQKMSFVTLVVKVPFETLTLENLPDGLRFLDTDISGLPHSIRYIYGYPSDKNGKLIVEKSKSKSGNLKQEPQVAFEPVTVNGQPGRCIQGVMDKDNKWQAKAEAIVLEWVESGFEYRISHTNLKLDCEGLLKIMTVNP